MWGMEGSSHSGMGFSDIGTEGPSHNQRSPHNQFQNIEQISQGLVQCCGRS
jgi:hypothetical protein